MSDETTREDAEDATHRPPEKSPLEILKILDRLQDTGRNDPCPCGSGRKYKKCCLPRDEARAHQAALERDRIVRGMDRPAPVGEPLAPVEGPDDLAVDAEVESVTDLEADADSTSDYLGVKPEAKDERTPEVRRALGEVWAEFDAVKHPTTAQMDALLTRLLALPPEATEWNELFHLLVRHGHSDLPGCFRRIAVGVRATEGAALGFFYWAAIEGFVKRGQLQLVPEVVAAFCTLNRKTYDADSLHHVQLWAMAAGFEKETLALAERFLPELRGDENLMPDVVWETCRMIFGLRVGTRLRDHPAPDTEPAALARELRCGIEEELHPSHGRRAAEVICGSGPTLFVTRHEFDLPVGKALEEEPVWEDSVRRFEAAMQVAREAWAFDHRPPGIALHGLQLLVEAAYRDREDRPSKLRRAPLNLLDCLEPGGMERRVALSARGLMETITPLAYLLLEAHADLRRFAVRHRLIEAHLAAKSEENVAMLKAKLGFPG